MKERITVQTSLLGIAKKAKSDKRYRFRNLYRELNEELLLDSWRLLRKDAALAATHPALKKSRRFIIIFPPL
jgi:RNA-directed DNA polymerase